MEMGLGCSFESTIAQQAVMKKARFCVRAPLLLAVTNSSYVTIFAMIG